MGLLFIGVVAGILVGFAWLAPSQGHFQACMFQWQGCLDKAVASSEPRPEIPRRDPAITKAKSAGAAKSSKHASARSHKRVAIAKADGPPTRHSVVASEHRPAGTSDLVLTTAKASIAAKMEDPASAEFSDVDRAIRLNTFGRPVDTICGHVKGKTASGGETAERPFLYLVKEDEAYVVADGKADSAAAIAYRNICH